MKLSEISVMTISPDKKLKMILDIFGDIGARHKHEDYTTNAQNLKNLDAAFKLLKKYHDGLKEPSNRDEF